MLTKYAKGHFVNKWKCFNALKLCYDVSMNKTDLILFAPPPPYKHSRHAHPAPLFLNKLLSTFNLMRGTLGWNEKGIKRLLYPRNEVEGGYTGFTLFVRPSVCLSVRPSVRPWVGVRMITVILFSGFKIFFLHISLGSRSCMGLNISVLPH